MWSYLLRRIFASVGVLLAASYVVYILTANAGDPLEELRTSQARNKDQLIAEATARLQLDVPAPIRYFIWLGGVLKGLWGQLDLGVTNTGLPVADLLGNAVVVTIRLLITATVLAIVVGITVGITTALRQYSAYDYSVTLLAFLFFSLPSFFVAVLLKQYAGIGFNDFLRDPTFSPWTIAITAIVMGVVWLGILGGDLRRRLSTFLVAALATAVLMTFWSITGWFADPGLGIVGVGVIGVGLAFLITALSTGLQNRRALYSALTVVVVGLAAYYPFMLYSNQMNLWILIGLGIVTIGVGLLVGWLWGGPDRGASMRTAALAGVLVAFTIVVDRLMQSWEVYASSQITNGRPIATVGAGTPNLSTFTDSFWIGTLDAFTHLLLPTMALLLISLASYSRYSRASLLEVLNQDYIRTARAKGLNERTIVMRHAFRNSLIPITTIVAFDFGGLIGGAIITETVFAWSGMGALFNTALQRIDLNQMMAFFLVTAAVALVFNLLADLTYSALDPRIRVASE